MTAIHAMTLTGLVGCAQPQNGVQESERTGISGAEKSLQETIPADYAVRIREASPDQNFYGQPPMLGSSADGFDRYLVHFNLEKDSNIYPRKSVQHPSIVLDTLSGTCASSYDNTKCGLDMAFVAYLITQPWDPKTVTWKTQPTFNNNPIAQSTHFSSSYQEITDHIWISIKPNYIQIPETTQVDGKTQMPYGLVIMVPNDTETTRQEQTLLHDKYQIGRAIQRDVLVGNPRLELTY